MPKLAVIPIRPNPKRKRRKAPKIHKRHKGKRAHKVRREHRAHGYLVQIGLVHDRIRYLAEGNKLTHEPSRARRFHTLKLARAACMGVPVHPQIRWAQPVPA